MRKELKCKILLCLLAGSVLTANTAFAAEYTGQIRGDKDSYGTEIKSTDGNGNYTYDFGESAELKVDNVAEGAIYVGRGNQTVKKIEINDALRIADSIIRKGGVTASVTLGVTGSTVADEKSNIYGIYVEDVDKGSNAFKASRLSPCTRMFFEFGSP